MRIAFIIYQGAVISGKSNGIRNQALTWKKNLEQYGNDVSLINHWESYDWNSFEAIHIFGYDTSIHTFVKGLYAYNQNIFISPIIDSLQPYWKYKLASFNGFEKLRLYSVNYSLKKAMPYIKGIFVRSKHEAGYFLNSLNQKKEKIHHVPLSYSLPVPKDIESLIHHKHPFCLHVSSLYQDRKNVKRLIEAAKKYKFNLKLVGNTGNKAQEDKIKGWIGQNDNIELLGYVSYEQLLNLYEKAKVFALPSTCEGVGIVALDAALYGNNIVLTNIAGPKEYYNMDVELIDPMSIDQIGKAVCKQMKIQSKVELSNFIKVNYSSEKSNRQLTNIYKNTL